MPIVAAPSIPEGTGAAGHFPCLVDLDAPCNLRCATCPRTGRGHSLDEAVAAAFFERIADQVVASRRSQAAVAFFGGEPLLAANQLLRQLRLLGARLDRASVAYRFALVTNGTLLTPGVAARLSAAGVARVLVTVCGCRPHHDERRRGPDGAPTYDRILANLAAARRHLEVHVRYELQGAGAFSCLTTVMADLLRRGCFASPHHVRFSVQGPSSYAALARSLVGPRLAPAGGQGAV